MHLERVAQDEIDFRLMAMTQQARDWTAACVENSDNSEVNVDDLCGGCAITAGLLFELMKNAVFQGMYIALNNMHSFVVWRLADIEIIIDPTAGQIKGCASIEFFIRAPIPRDCY